MAEELRTFAYICPECRQTVIAQRSAFSLAAGDCKIPCPCGKSTLSIENMGSMYHLSVPCVACGRNHDVSCPQEALLRRKAVALTCKATGFDSCIVGEESAVFEAAKRMEESADALPENAENGKEGFLNPIVMQEVLSEVKEIAQHGLASRTVYVLRDGKPVRVDVVTGLTDGMQTEIVSGDIAEGDKVVVDQQKGA